MNGSEEDPSEDRYYPVYQQHRGKLQEIWIDQSRELDKAVLTISSGALAISITFIDKIVHGHEILFPFFLLLSWLLFALTMFTTTLSFLTSRKSLGKQIDLYDDYYINNLPVERREKFYSFITTVLSVVSIICLVSGIASISYFAYANLLPLGKIT